MDFNMMPTVLRRPVGAWLRLYHNPATAEPTPQSHFVYNSAEIVDTGA
jgi:hypothetical protein